MSKIWRGHTCATEENIHHTRKRTKLSTSRVRSSSHRCRIYHRFWANDLTHLQYTIQTKLADINWIADSIRWPPQWWTKSLISFSYFLFVIFSATHGTVQLNLNRLIKISSYKKSFVHLLSIFIFEYIETNMDQAL